MKTPNRGIRRSENWLKAREVSLLCTSRCWERRRGSEAFGLSLGTSQRNPGGQVKSPSTGTGLKGPGICQLAPEEHSVRNLCLCYHPNTWQSGWPVLPGTSHYTDFTTWLVCVNPCVRKGVPMWACDQWLPEFRISWHCPRTPCPIKEGHWQMVGRF